MLATVVVPRGWYLFPMTVIDTMSFPAPRTPGSQLVSRLPHGLSKEREDALFELFQAGEFPMWLRQWHEVTVQDGDVKGAFYVLPDYLCIGTDDDWVYTPMGAIGAERVLSLFKAALPTQKMVELLYKKAVKQVAQPWGPPYDTMALTDRWLAQTRKIRKGLELTKAYPGQLVEGHAKNVVVSKKTMDADGLNLGFFGWYDTAGRPIQGDSQAHGAWYCDYSHGVRAVLGNVVVSDVLMPYGTALSHPVAWRLFSHEPIDPPTYRTAQQRYQQRTGKEPPVRF